MAITGGVGRGTGSLTGAAGTITTKSNKDGTKTAVTINYHARFHGGNHEKPNHRSY